MEQTVFTVLQMSSSLVATGALLKGLVFKMKESVAFSNFDSDFL